jgi:hypothetical protein
MNDLVDGKRKFVRKPYINFYKPLKKDGAGAALQFSYDAAKHAIFLEATKQQGPKLAIGAKEQFDWEKKIVFKIGTADVARLLVVFSGHKKEAKCIHAQQGTGRTSVFELNRGEYNGEPNFALKLARTAEGQTQSVNMFLTQEEVALLAHFTRESLTRMFGFGDV